MGIFKQEDEGGEDESESYDYRRDSFPFAYQGVYYQLVEPGEHPARKLASATLPGAPIWTEQTEFWSVLRIFLQKHYTHEATEKIVECVKQVCSWGSGYAIVQVCTCKLVPNCILPHELKLWFTWLLAE